MVEFILELLQKSGVPVQVIVGIAIGLLCAVPIIVPITVAAIYNIDKIKLHILAPTFEFFSRFIDSFQKKAIAYKLEGKLNTFANNAKNISGIKGEAEKVKVEWITNKSDTEAILNEGNVLIRMKDTGSRNKNIVHASMFYLSSSFLQRTKKYLSKTIKNSIDLHVGKKLFEEEHQFIQEYFNTDYYLPLTDNNENLNALLQNYEYVDRGGLFFPVYIHELHSLVSKSFSGNPSQRINQEAKNLNKFLKEFISTEMGHNLHIN